MRTMIFALLLSLVFSTAYAQPTVYAGIKGGVNLTGITDNMGYTSPEVLLSPRIGGLLQFRFGEDSDGKASFILQPELLYNALGENDGSDKLKLHYISLPLLIQREFGTSGISIFTGPQVSYLLSATKEPALNGINIKDDFKSIDFSIAGGLQYVHSSGLGAQLQVHRGVTSLAKEETMRHTGFSFSLLYLFGKSADNYW